MNPAIPVVDLASAIVSRYRRSAVSEKDATGPRFVTLAEILAAHPDSPEGCVCGGSGEIPILRNGKSGTGYCPRAVDELERRSGFDIASTPLEPHWVEVADPENWALRQIFAASMLRIAQDDELRRRYPIQARSRASRLAGEPRPSETARRLR